MAILAEAAKQACRITCRTLLVVVLLLPHTARAEGFAESIAPVVARVSAAVIRVITVRRPHPEPDKTGPEITGTVGVTETTASFGSGFIIDPSGYIATNRHVIDDAIALFVATADGVRHRAKLIGMPFKVDMALLKIEAGHDLPYLSFGDSDKVRVGDVVIAIGSPFGFDNTVTAGIVSAVNRDIMESPFDEYFQTDAATNLGNSGGPLLNLAGEVIGMNSVIFTPTSGWVGLSFALPSNDLRFVFGRLMKTGKVRAGMLPITTQQVSWMLQQALDSPGLEGALVSSVSDEGDLTLRQEIAPGDIILSFNGQKVLDPRDLARKAAQATIGSEAILEVYRGGRRTTIRATIRAWPEAEVPAANGSQPTLGVQLRAGHRDTGEPIVVVAAIDPQGSAADSGLRKDDVIIEVQQTRVREPGEALSLLRERSNARHPFAAVLVERGKQQIWIPIAVPGQN